MRLLVLALLALFPFAATRAANTPTARVLIVGTWHFTNPGLDLHNMRSDDVLSPARQKEIHAVALALETFAPTKVFVEWPETAAAETYAEYRTNQLAPEQRKR